MLSPEFLDAQPVNGISVFFILLFYGPLLLVVLVFTVHALMARRSVLGLARLLSGLWLFACVPAGLMILMGFAFNSSGKNIVLQLGGWVGIGLALLWLPVGLRKLSGRSPL